MKLILVLAALLVLPAQGKNPPFVEGARRQIAPLYLEILNHPFNQELASGKLPKEKFDYYSAQDVVYLRDFTKALMVLASKLEDPEQQKCAIELAKSALQEPAAALKAPNEIMAASVFYSSYLLSTAAYGSKEELAAALLPCFQIYLEVARDLIVRSPADNPYLGWLKTYSSPKYAATVDKMKKLTEDLAQAATPELRAKMQKAYAQASRLEWYFWNDAYSMGKWLPR